MRGIPTRVTQEELKSKKANIDTRGIAKEEVLEVYLKCTNLSEASIYDTNNVHYIGMVLEELKWVVKKKE